MFARGRYIATAEGVRVRWIIAEHVTNDRRIVEHLLVNLTIEDMRVHLDNLYQDEKELGKTIDRFKSI